MQPTTQGLGNCNTAQCTWIIAPKGTTFKFDPLMAGDTMVKNGIQWSIETKHQRITAMKTYQNKSVEPDSSSGSRSMGNLNMAPHGTTFKFEPLVAGDTMFKNGIQWNIQTKHQCITAMKTYQNKSVEELRFEDYVANRKGRGSVFPSNTLFGQQNRPLVGGSAIPPKKIATLPTKKITKDQCSQTDQGASGLESELKQLQLQEGINDLKNQLTKSLKAKDEEIEEVKEQPAKVQQQLVEIQSVMGAPAT